MKLLYFPRFLILVLSLSFLTSGYAAGLDVRLRQSLPGEPAAPQASEEIMYVEWTITANGESDANSGGTRTTTRHRIQISGSAVIHKPAQGFLNTIPMQVSVMDTFYQVETTACSEDHQWITILDSGRYNGGPDEFWVYPTTFWAQQRDDGSWYMENPLSDLRFAINGQLGRTFTYRYADKYNDLCGNNDSSGSMDLEMANYIGILMPLRSMPLEGDATGTVFNLNTTYTVEYAAPILNVNFNASVRLGSCKDLPAPIDINNSSIRTLDVNIEGFEMTPDQERDVVISVTCQGVPVQNAVLNVSVLPRELSGWHLHGGDRPRGILNGLHITKNMPSVPATTGADGQARVSFKPGWDLSLVKNGGFAGIYEVTARVVDARFAGVKDTAYIDVRFRLDALSPTGSLIFLPGPEIYHHPSLSSASVATQAMLINMATAWQVLQLAHNAQLQSLGRPPWLVVPLYVRAISLHWGGLFDITGAWRTPFWEHQRGTDVMFWSPLDTGMPVVFPPDGTVAEAQAWLYMQFWSLGNMYGGWFVDGGSTYNLATGSTSMPLKGSVVKGTQATPDIAAVVFLSSPQGRNVVGAGQTVTYTVGLENLTSGTQASNVTLTAGLPAGTNFISANPVPSSMANARTPVWNIGSLPDEGSPRLFNITAQIDPSIAAGTVLTATAMASTGSLDANPANNSFISVGLSVQAPGPDLVIQSNLDGTHLTVSDPVSFTMRLSNEGNALASNSWVELVVPDGITITLTSPASTPILHGAHWNAGSLAQGASQTFTATLNVDPELVSMAELTPDQEPVYPLAFSIKAGPANPDIAPSNNQLQVNKRVEMPGPDLQIALQPQGTPGPGFFTVTQEVTYTLRYANSGNRDAAGVTATLLLYPGLQLLDATPAASSNTLDPNSGVRTVTWSLGNLEAGGFGELVVRLKVASIPAVDSILLVRLSSNTSDTNPANDVVMEVRQSGGVPANWKRVFLPMVRR